MKRIYHHLFAITLCIPFVGNSQVESSNGLSLEKCNNQIAIAHKGDLSALYDYQKEQFLTKFDRSFFHYFPEQHCVMQLTKEDSIVAYGLSNGESTRLFSAYRTIRVDFMKEGLLYKGKFVPMKQVEEGDLPSNGLISGEFGLEQIDDVVIVLDYKHRGSPGTSPVLGEDGKPVIVEVNGMNAFVYPAGEKGYSKGGVRDRASGDWIIEPQANFVVKGSKGYLVEVTTFNDVERYSGADDQTVYRYYDFSGSLLKNDFSEEELMQSGELKRLLVPRYDSDTIWMIEDHKMVPIKEYWWHFDKAYFKTEGKTGMFQLGMNEIVESPVDFMHPSMAGVFTRIDGDQISIRIKGYVEEFNFDGAYSFEFYQIAGDCTRGDMCMRVRNKEVDNVYTYFYNPHNSFTSDSMNVLPFEQSILAKAFIRKKSYTEYMLNEIWTYGIVHDGRGHLIVNHHGSFAYDQMKLVDSDPNSPNFGLFQRDEQNVEIWRKQARTLGHNRSGVFDLQSHEWIIPSTYHRIEQTDEGYKVDLYAPASELTDTEYYNREGKLLRKED